MTISTFGAIVATLIAGADSWMRAFRRANDHARVIRYLEGMPPYLRSDIGLQGDADLRAVVHGTGASRMADREVQSHIGMTGRLV